jgi:hypothetical protein
MLPHDLPFTEEDLMLIELGIAHRMHRPTLVAAAGSTAAGNREGR